jgi:tRNA dimethylallyltransferase
MLLADRFGAEILSVDSMQVYRGMDIGTAKPTAADRAIVQHHMIDVAEPDDVFSVAEFQRLARAAIGECAAAETPVLVVGGSGLHFRSVVDPYEFGPTDESVRSRLEGIAPEAAVSRLLEQDPEAGQHVDLANPRRVIRALEELEISGRPRRPSEDVKLYRSLHPFVGMGVDAGKQTGDRVSVRFDGMIAAGLLGEVEALAPRLGATAAQAAGYRELLDVVAGTSSLEEATKRAIEATRGLARRQRTFFRRDPRIRWLEWDDDPVVVADRAASVLEEAGWNS